MYKYKVIPKDIITINTLLDKNFKEVLAIKRNDYIVILYKPIKS